ncbi:hypothetical protein ACU8KH_01003 [Lachancea thermotolerans]
MNPGHVIRKLEEFGALRCPEQRNMQCQLRAGLYRVSIDAVGKWCIRCRMSIAQALLARIMGEHLAGQNGQFCRNLSFAAGSKKEMVSLTLWVNRSADLGVNTRKKKKICRMPIRRHSL